MNEHPSLETATSGSIRFNTDSSKLEIYNGEQWWEIDSTSPEQQTGGTRGLVAGGYSPSMVNTIDFINVDTTGDATDFGDLPSVRFDFADLNPLCRLRLPMQPPVIFTAEASSDCRFERLFAAYGTFDCRCTCP